MSPLTLTTNTTVSPVPTAMEERVAMELWQSEYKGVGGAPLDRHCCFALHGHGAIFLYWYGACMFDCPLTSGSSCHSRLPHMCPTSPHAFPLHCVCIFCNANQRNKLLHNSHVKWGELGSSHHWCATNIRRVIECFCHISKTEISDLGERTLSHDV